MGNESEISGFDEGMIASDYGREERSKVGDEITREIEGLRKEVARIKEEKKLLLMRLLDLSKEFVRAIEKYNDSTEWP